MESVHGEGTTFYFTLPLYIEQKEATIIEAKVRNIAAEKQIHIPKILIAEDDEPLAKLIAFVLKPFSQEVYNCQKRN